ncbi:hypothetical protein [Nakamurella aerolata]|uniref:Tetratricopeptide repeat protein n=1 Tax=Nakamurella aerolata TaxID=1656892 RepID=A0A849AEI3_9ACTN|nr:hypothetical protein [Nakamurella aerolata]NNG37621.1 hypothetical protein [Nakamurella aerolata]
MNQYVVEQLLRFESMESSESKGALLQQFQREAEASGDPVLVVCVQLELFVNWYNLGRWETAAPYLAQLIGGYQRHREHLPDFAIEQTMTAVSQAGNVLPTTDRLSAAQIDTALAEVDRMVRGAGLDQQELLAGRINWEMQRGRLNAAADLLQRWYQGADLTDPYDAYAAARFLFHQREFAAAVRTMDQVPSPAVREAELTLEYAGLAAWNLLFLGQFDDARRQLQAIVDATSGGGSKSTDAIAFGEAGAVLAVLGDPEAAAGCALEASLILDVSEMDALDRQAAEAGIARGLRDSPDRVGQSGVAAASALAIADGFDRRNDSSYQTWLVRRTLDLPPAYAGVR